MSFKLFRCFSHLVGFCYISFPFKMLIPINPNRDPRDDKNIDKGIGSANR